MQQCMVVRIPVTVVSSADHFTSFKQSYLASSGGPEQTYEDLHQSDLVELNKHIWGHG
jgi:ABC-type sugar transport system permease subunit